MTAIDKIAPYKNQQVKGNTQKWFHGKVLEKLNLRNKFFKKQEFSKKSKYDYLKLSRKNKHILKRSSNYWLT